MNEYQLLWLSGMLIGATLLAWWPGFVARRNEHPRAALVNVAGLMWLVVSVPALWFRPDLSLISAVAWVAVTLAAYVKPRRA
jgi:hypothetical protein